MLGDKPTDKTRYVILESLRFGSRFFSIYKKDADHTKLENGEVAYKILGYADNMVQAQTYLYGRYFTTRKD